MIPIAEPDLTGNEQKYLTECISTGYVSSVGKFVSLFEDRLAAAVDAKYAIAVNSGTSALHLALMAIGVKENDLVILPSFTFIASANAISYCGASPWLFDVSQDNWTLDPNLLEKTLAKETTLSGGKLIHRETNRVISAMMPVYTNGTPAEMDSIVQIANQYNLPIIADAAAAIGAKYNGQQTGAIKTDLTAYSFNGNKTITCGGGGAIVGNDKALLEKIRHLSTTARVGRDYNHDVVGYNYRMTNLQAAVGVAQLERLDEFIKKKRYIKQLYNRIIENIDSISPFPEIDRVESSCWFSGLLIAEKYDMEGVRSYLLENGIESRKFWKPMHLQQPYNNSPKTTMKICNNIWQRVLVLPSSYNLTDDNLNYIIKMVSNALRKNG